MKLKCISQEVLKLIACMTMLLDHIGATLIPWSWLRIVGRISFPIYCFLLVEGISHSRDLKKYGLRLFAGALLAELPFDYLFFGGFTWDQQSVMLSLFIGFIMLVWARRYGILVPFIVCYFAAEYLNVDYRGFGMVLIAVFYVAATYGKQFERLLETAGVAVACWMKNTYRVPVFGLGIPIQTFGVFAMIPIALYTGEKKTHSKWIQWAFYLFYPVHMIALLLIRKL